MDDEAAGFEQIFGSDVASRKQKTSQVQAETDRLVGECMTGAGFEISDELLHENEFLVNLASMSTEEFVDEYGFGRMASAEAELDGLGQDPVIAYRASLDPSGQVAFDQALLGDPDADASADSTDGGCVGEARSKSGGDVIFDVDSLDEMEERIRADPGYAPLLKENSDCMSENGYPDAADVPRCLFRTGLVIDLDVPETASISRCAGLGDSRQRVDTACRGSPTWPVGQALLSGQ